MAISFTRRCEFLEAVWKNAWNFHVWFTKRWLRITGKSQTSLTTNTSLALGRRGACYTAVDAGKLVLDGKAKKYGSEIAAKNAIVSYLFEPHRDKYYANTQVNRIAGVFIMAKCMEILFLLRIHVSGLFDSSIWDWIGSVAVWTSYDIHLSIVQLSELEFEISLAVAELHVWIRWDRD